MATVNQINRKRKAMMAFTVRNHPAFSFKCYVNYTDKERKAIRNRGKLLAYASMYGAGSSLLTAIYRR